MPNNPKQARQHQRPQHHNNTVTQKDFETSNLSFSLMPNNNLPHQLLMVNNTEINFLLDTGTTIITISEDTFNSMRIKLDIKKFHGQVLGYLHDPLHILGEFTGSITNGLHNRLENIAVVKGTAVNLLSCQACVALDLITINSKASKPFKFNLSTIVDSNPTVPQLNKLFPDLFKSEIGKIKNVSIKLTIDKNVAPVIQKPRHTPYHLRDKIEEKIKILLDDDVIRPAQSPISWVSSLVPVLKPNGDVRITTDSRAANEAIKRTHHPMPTPDDVTMMVNGATHFTKLDIKESFYMLELAEECRYITAFRTHIGLFEFNRLNMGINAATEIFQQAVERILAKLPKTRNMIDDILIWGTGQEDHNTQLTNTLKTLNDANFTLNQGKCVFNTNKINFYGLEISNKGVKVTEDKIKALTNAKPPTTVKMVQSFMGLAQFCKKQIPNLSTIAKPLTDITRKSNP